MPGVGLSARTVRYNITVPSLDRTTYDSSQVNWGRLRAYARRVASEATKPTTAVTAQDMQDRVQTSVVVVDDCWVLDRRTAEWTTERPKDTLYRRVEGFYTYRGLRRDGSLFCATVGDHEMFSSVGGWSCTINGAPVVSDMTVEDVMSFDFHPDLYRGRRGDQRVERDDMFGKRLRYHAKGVGLNLALGRVLR